MATLSRALILFKRSEKVQRLELMLVLPGNPGGSARHPHPYVFGKGDEIVQAQKKFWGTCNH